MLLALSGPSIMPGVSVTERCQILGQGHSFRFVEAACRPLL